MQAGKCASRRLIRVAGVVQGVGFRPFVYSLAHRMGLSGWSVTGGTSSLSSPYFVVNTDSSGEATAQIANLLSQNIRLTGTRFAKVLWSASTNGAQAVLSLGGDSWNLQAGSPGAQTTMIDLCSPDVSTVPGNTSTTTEETATLNQVIESPHPVTGSYYDPAWTGTFSAPSNALSVTFHVDSVGAGYGINVYNADTTDWLGYISESGYTQSFDATSCTNFEFEIWLYPGGQEYGLKITQEQYTYDAPITIEASKMQSIIPFEQPLDMELCLDRPGQSCWNARAGLILFLGTSCGLGRRPGRQRQARM